MSFETLYVSSYFIGNLLETAIINLNKKSDAERILIGIVTKHRLDTETMINISFKYTKIASSLVTYLINSFSISLIAIGNGTGCRDCETMVAQLIQNKRFHGRYRFLSV